MARSCLDTKLLSVFLLVLGLVLAISSEFNVKHLGPCERASIVERKEWRARPAARTRHLVTPVKHVIILHTNTQECHNEMACMRNTKFIQDLNLDDRGWEDIAYNFLIGGDGRVYSGRGWELVGSHSLGYNQMSIGVAFIGNYMKVEPNKTMLDAALNLIRCGVEKGFLTPSREIHGHRDITCTDSPGDRLYEIIKNWVNFKGGRLPGYKC